jgi:NADH-quinone oxidoreductase subunit M
VAYSSVSHMNFIVLGIFALNALGINGAIFQMVAHGLTTAFLFLVVAVLYERREVRELSAFGGLWKQMPAYGGLALLGLLAAAGLPGLMSFIGEFTIMQGVLISPALGWPFAAGAAVGVILAATYTLRWFRIAFMGESDPAQASVLPDLNGRERLLLGALTVALVAFGLFPNLLLASIGGSVDTLVAALAPLLSPAAGL